MLRTLLIGIIIAMCAGDCLAGGVVVRDLKCEYRTSPLGIDVVQPRLSWKIDSSERGAVQTAYQVLVSSTEEGLSSDKGDLWDSGKVESDQSIHIVYAGKPLASRQRCYWKVRTWDKHGKTWEWSKPALWTMGLLDASDWKGKWIGLDGGESPDYFADAQWITTADGAKTGHYFRRTFDIPKDTEISAARVTIRTDGLFSIFVNGEIVARDTRVISSPAFEFDIENHLHAGPNTIAISVTPNPGADTPPLICAFSVEFESGEPMIVPSDAAWKASSASADGWQKPSFDDSAWAAAVLVTPAPDKPSGKDFRKLPARMLRRELTIDSSIKRASVHMCGLGLSELYINGEKIGDAVLSPGLTDYAKRSLYVTHDVTKELKNGANAIGVILGNGRYFAPRLESAWPCTTYGYPKLLFEMEIEHEDGSTSTLISDESWKLTTDGPIRANNEYDGEVYDSRRAMPGWSSPGFDDSKWQAAHVVEAPKGVLSADMAEPIRVMDNVKPVAITNPRPGVYIYDMGQNMVGWCRLKVKGPRGARVCLRFAEQLTMNTEHPLAPSSSEHPELLERRGAYRSAAGAATGELYLANLRSCKVTDQYILSGDGVETWEPRFIYHGFRYVELTGYPGTPDLSAIEGVVVHDALGRAGEFACSNELINRIYRNMYWGIRGNFRSIPTDCPQRDERHGWFGDRAQVTKGEMYIFDTAAVQTKWIRDIEDSQREDGSIPDLAPAFWTFYTGSVTFPTASFVIPGHIYTVYGDKRILETHYDSIRHWTEMMLTRLTDGLLPEDTYGDWCVPPENPKLIHATDPSRVTNKQLVSNVYFYSDLRQLAQFAALIGRKEDASRYNEIADKLKTAFNARFLNVDEGCYDNATQSSSVLPLAVGLVPDDETQRVFAKLVDNITNKTDYHIGTGMIGGQWLMRVLSDNGRPDIAYRLATQTTFPSWGYMISQGATTIWELWNGDHGDPLMNSHNHVMQIGDLAIWLHEYVAGIAPDEARPGFKHIIMRPLILGDLTSARATHESPCGAILSDWKLINGTFTWQIKVPANSTATVYVPTSDASSVTESGKPATSADGVTFLRVESDCTVFEVGSGDYKFKSDYAHSPASTA